MNYKNVAVIIPTFNESLNIALLLSKIYDILPNASIFVVDDSDEKEYEKLKKNITNPEVIVMNRTEKLGRGDAVIAGFKEALKNPKIDYFFEMDADLQHDPSDFPAFLKKMDEENADLVVGTRYDGQGEISDWPMDRLIKSKVANLYLKSMLGLDLTDFTSGFRLYSRRAVELLVKVDFKISGFIRHSESAYHIKKNELKITEVPIHFKSRKHGQSSLGSEKKLETFYGILKIRFGK
jgi:dolichol-phosphate mannosyltransferase